MMLTDLAKACRKSGLEVIEVPGRKTRGHGEMAGVKSIVCHNTAGPREGDIPSLKFVRDGHPGLSGPLSRLMLHSHAHNRGYTKTRHGWQCSKHWEHCYC